MYEYKVVKLKLSAFNLLPDEDYRSVVGAHEKEGWELEKIDPGITGAGIPAFFELLFKRRIKKAERKIELK